MWGTLQVTKRTRSLKRQLKLDRWNWPVCLLRFLTVTLHSKKLVKSLGGRYQNVWILWKLLYLVTCFATFILLYCTLYCVFLSTFIFLKELSHVSTMRNWTLNSSKRVKAELTLKKHWFFCSIIKHKSASSNC